MTDKFRPYHRIQGSGPWIVGADQDGPLLVVSGLEPGQSRVFKVHRVQEGTGILSPASNVVHATPGGTGGGGGAGNPSPLVTWDRPTPENVGLLDEGALQPAGYYAATTQTLIQDLLFEGGLLIAGGPRVVDVVNCRVRQPNGQGGSVLNTMSYGITAAPSFAGGTVRVWDCDVAGASSANIYQRYGLWDVRRCVFPDSGADHVKGGPGLLDGSGVWQSYYGRMANSWLNRNYNDPTHPQYQILSYVHGDANQVEDLAPGVTWSDIGNFYDQIGTYAPSGGPVPSHPGYPIGPYSAATYCVARHVDIVGTSTKPPFHLEGSWYNGSIVPVRLESKNGRTNSHWWLKNSVFMGNSEFHPLVSHSSINVTDGNIWEDTGQNIDNWLLTGSGTTPPGV